VSVAVPLKSGSLASDVLIGVTRSPNRTTHAPQASPAPTAVKTAVSPPFISPSSIASTNAVGIDAAEVFPYR
jgi:hypothetical protein